MEQAAMWAIPRMDGEAGVGDSISKSPVLSICLAKPQQWGEMARRIDLKR